MASAVRDHEKSAARSRPRAARSARSALGVEQPADRGRDVRRPTAGRRAAPRRRRPRAASWRSSTRPAQAAAHRLEHGQPEALGQRREGQARRRRRRAPRGRRSRPSPGSARGRRRGRPARRRRRPGSRAARASPARRRLRTPSMRRSRFLCGRRAETLSTSGPSPSPWRARSSGSGVGATGSAPGPSGTTSILSRRDAEALDQLRARVLAVGDDASAARALAGTSSAMPWRSRPWWVSGWLA